MAEITLAAESNRTLGSRPSGRLRHSGRIPGVIYGHNTDPVHVSVDAHELRRALSTDAGLNQLLDLHVGEKKYLTLARELQRHPVRNTVTHIDFLVVRRDEVISADVPLNLIGEAKQVEQERGVINHNLTSISVNAVPAAIPHSIDVDISELAIGDAIRVHDLQLPNGVTTEVEPEEVVVAANPPEAEEPEEGEGEEGAEGEGEGEAAGESSDEGSSDSEG